MLQIVVRSAKRLAIFIPGILIAYVSFRYTLPFFDKRLPDLIAVLITYAIAAYILIPALIRLWRIIYPPKHLPLYCITPDGFASDPLNLAIIASRRELIETMQSIGWQKADKHTVLKVTRHILSVVFGWTYLNAPVSNLYLFGRKQDIAFEKKVGVSTSARHHIRFWATTYNPQQPISLNTIRWQHLTSNFEGNNLIWVGAASLDIGIVPIKHNFQLTHKVHSDTNQEREYIVSEICKLDKIKRVIKVKLGDPYKLVNRTWRGELQTDGNMTVINLK